MRSLSLERAPSFYGAFTERLRSFYLFRCKDKSNYGAPSGAIRLLRMWVYDQQKMQFRKTSAPIIVMFIGHRIWCSGAEYQCSSAKCRCSGAESRCSGAESRCSSAKSRCSSAESRCSSAGRQGCADMPTMQKAIQLVEELEVPYLS